MNQDNTSIQLPQAQQIPQGQAKLLNPLMFSTPKSLKEKIDQASDVHKQTDQLQKQINKLTANKEDSQVQKDQKIATEADYQKICKEILQGIENLFTLFIQRQDKTFIRFGDAYLRQLAQIKDGIKKIADEKGLKYKYIANNKDIVVYKQEDEENNFSIHVGPLNSNHPRNCQNPNQQIAQESLLESQSNPQAQIQQQVIQQSPNLPEQNKLKPLQAYYNIPPDNIKNYCIMTQETAENTIVIRFDKPDDNGSPIDNYRVCILDFTDLFQIRPTYKLINEFMNPENVISVVLTFGTNQLPFDEILKLSINAHNQYGWSSDSETDYCQLLAKRSLNRSVFQKGRVNFELISDRVTPLAQVQIIEIGDENIQVLDDFCEILIEPSRLRSVSTKFQTQAVINSSFKCCIWGKVLDFEGQESSNFQVNLDTDIIMTPPYQIPTSRAITKIACGEFHCLAITIEGSLLSWGVNTYGQLGIGTTESHMNPVEINFFKNQQLFVVDVQAGALTSMCRVNQMGSNVYSWGHQQNDFGPNMVQLQNRFEDVVNLQCVDEANYQPLPRKANLESKQISMGYNTFAALSPDGFVYMWGNNQRGEMGFTVSELLNDQLIIHLVNPMRINTGHQFRYKWVDIIAQGRQLAKSMITLWLGD